MGQDQRPDLDRPVLSQPEGMKPELAMNPIKHGSGACGHSLFALLSHERSRCGRSLPRKLDDARARVISINSDRFTRPPGKPKTASNRMPGMAYHSPNHLPLSMLLPVRSKLPVQSEASLAIRPLASRREGNTLKARDEHR